MAIAAYCTNGKELPNPLPIEPFNVLYQTAEDGIADTIKPRLAKCGADMTRVRSVSYTHLRIRYRQNVYAADRSRGNQRCITVPDHEVTGRC